MSGTLHFSPYLRVLLSQQQQDPSRDWSIWSVSCPNLSIPSLKNLSLREKFVGFHFLGTLGGKLRVFNASSQGGSLQELDDQPASVELEPICSESQFDRILAEAQQLEEPIIVVWMASWCRKCIYLKPKLEKLAANYHPRLRFYCVDVNDVPHKLVVRAGVTKQHTRFQTSRKFFWLGFGVGDLLGDKLLRECQFWILGMGKQMDNQMGARQSEQARPCVCDCHHL